MVNCVVSERTPRDRQGERTLQRDGAVWAAEHRHHLGQPELLTGAKQFRWNETGCMSIQLCWWLKENQTTKPPLHHATEVSECCPSNDSYICRAVLNLILHVGAESQGQNSLWQRQEYSHVFGGCLVWLVLVLLWDFMLKTNFLDKTLL